MTTTYKTVKEVYERKVFESAVCDGCGQSLPEEYGNESYNTREFTLEFTQGEAYPDGSA